MIVMTLNDVRKVIDPLKKLSEQEFPAKYSWQIMDLCEIIGKLVNRIEDSRVKLIEQYGDKTFICLDIETNEQISFTEQEFNSGIDETKYTFITERKEVKNQDNLAKFYNEFNELLSLEQDIIEKEIDLSAVADKITISAQDLYVLKKLVTF